MANNSCDTVLRGIFGYNSPNRNDCGYPGRYNHEDCARMHGWDIEGANTCDYPDGCEWFETGKCPFYNKEKMIQEMKELYKKENK